MGHTQIETPMVYCIGDIALATFLFVDDICKLDDDVAAV